MTTQDTRNWRKVVIAGAALLAVLFPLLGEAAPLGKAKPLIQPRVSKQCVSRSLSDFLNAQGTLNNPPQFFPPLQDYVGWVDGKGITFALVDYAGLADTYIKAATGHSLGTKVRGTVMQCELADGRAEITVALSTTKALGFAQSIADLTAHSFDFLNTPTIFGVKAQDVVNGEAPATGPVSLFTIFSISAPGAALPDFLAVVNNPAPYAPVKYSFMSTTCGRSSDGRIARLDVHQMASTNRDKEFVYTVEHVNVVGAQGGNCDE